jgi:DNA-binding NarL/FixJ family response regulator
VLIVDDHPLVRERLAELIGRQEDLAVCGEADERAQALEVLARLRPELVIVDLTLRNSDGIDLVKDIHAQWPRMRILVVSMHDESLYAERVLRAGAHGYITKQEATRSILVAIRTVLRGEIYLRQEVAARLLARLGLSDGLGVGDPVERLADRELQVLELTGRGLNTREVAARLRISAKTAETYRARIREKLGLETASELLQFAISWAHDCRVPPDSQERGGPD